MSRPPNEVVPGPAARRVVENVTKLRRARGTREDLSKRLTTAGRPIRTTGLARLEAGRRRVDVDDLLALALALGVSPLRLLLPGRDEHGEHPRDVELTDAVTVPWEQAWRWAAGEAPIPLPGEGASHSQFLAENRPFDPRTHELPPAARARIEHLETQVKALHALLEVVAPGGVAALIRPDGTVEDVSRGEHR